MKKNITNGGFTLAETLITLVIVGVIAAITVPSLIVKCQKNIYYSRFLKAQATLNNALYKSIAINGSVSTWELPDNLWAGEINNFFNKYFIPYLNIQKKCFHEENSMKPCFANIYKDLKNNTYTNAWDISNNKIYYDRYVINDGMSIQIASVTKDEQNNHLYYIIIWVDTNGPQKPNIYGRDTFQFCVYYPNISVVPCGIYSDISTKKLDSLGNLRYKCNQTNIIQGPQCGGLLLIEHGMNY